MQDRSREIPASKRDERNGGEGRLIAVGKDVGEGFGRKGLKSLGVGAKGARGELERRKGGRKEKGRRVR